jgi:hypothetical protein
MKTFVLDTEAVEEHVAATNPFFQQTHYTLDDMAVYTNAFAPALQAVYSAGEEYITEEQLFDAIRQSVASLKEINEALNIANA